jgi:hypothetical protein
LKELCKARGLPSLRALCRKAKINRAAMCNLLAAEHGSGPYRMTMDKLVAVLGVPEDVIRDLFREVAP